MSTAPKHIEVPELEGRLCTGCAFYVPGVGCKIDPHDACDREAGTIFIPDTPEGKVAYATLKLTL